MGAGREGGKGNGGRKGGKGEPDHFAECHRVMNLAKASGKEGKDKDDGWAGGCQETAPSETPSEPEQTAVLAMLPEDNSCEEDGFGAEGSGTEGGSGAEGNSTEGSGRGSGAEDNNGTEGSEEGSATEGSTSEPLTEEAPEAEAAAAVLAELPEEGSGEEDWWEGWCWEGSGDAEGWWWHGSGAEGNGVEGSWQGSGAEGYGAEGSWQGNGVVGRWQRGWRHDPY